MSRNYENIFVKYKIRNVLSKNPAQSLQLIKPPNLSCKYDGIKVTLETYKNKHLGKTHLGSFVELSMISQLGCICSMLLEF